MNGNNSTIVVKTGFKKGYVRLPEIDQIELKDEMMIQADWSLSTFYNKMKGTRRLRKPEIPIVEEVFQKFGIDPWTGDRTN